LKVPASGTAIALRKWKYEQFCPFLYYFFQENAVLEEQLGEYGRKEDELRSLQEEISILEDVR